MYESPRPYLALVGAVALTVGCGSNELGGPPVLEDALWSVSIDAAQTGSCFGTAVATADVDGDGDREVLVGAGRCAGSTRPGSDRLFVFSGTEGLPEARPHSSILQWENSNPVGLGGPLSIATGDVDGDGARDVLVGSGDGASLYRGEPDLRDVFTSPTFRVPGDGSFEAAVLADVDADGRDDIVVANLGIAVYLAPGPDEPASAFALSRTLDGDDVTAIGDLDGDGADELIVERSGRAQLYMGCPRATSGASCSGGVSGSPVWSIDGPVVAAVNGIGGAGTVGVFSARGGRVSLYVADADAVTPRVWFEDSDPLYPLLGAAVVAMGDVSGDGVDTEVVISALGRAYLFAASRADPTDYAPVRTWPDEPGPSFPGYFEYTAAPTVDLTGDGRPEIVLARGRAGDATARGAVGIYDAAVRDASAPRLPDPLSCDPGGDGAPDLTIDRDLLARSLYISREHFDADACEVSEGCVSGAGQRRLLRFGVSTVNLGSGPAVLPGPQVAPELYEFDQCHGHEHLSGFASYELDDPARGVVVRGRKQGFFLVDVARYCAGAPGPADPADWWPNVAISAGWSDVYTSDLPCQWLDITDLTDGIYDLRVTVNGDGLIPEADHAPNAVTVRVEIAGDRAVVIP